MKKIILTLTLLISVTLVSAQKKNVNSAYNETWATAPNYEKARNLLAAAKLDSTTAEWSKTWAAAGLVEMSYFTQELTLGEGGNQDAMYQALKDAYGYFKKTIVYDSVPDSKGKIKLRYTKDAVEKLTEYGDYYYYGGGYFFNKGEEQEAYDFFRIYDELCRLPVMQEEGIDCNDSNHIQARYFAAVMALKLNDNKAAIEALTLCKDDNYNGPDVYNYLAYVYGQANDTTNQIATFKEGLKKFGAAVNTEDFAFMSRLINIYISKSDVQTVITMLEDALVENPSDHEYWKLLGTLYYDQKNEEKAIAALEKSIEVKPDYADAYGELGRIYFNAAISESNRVNDIKDNAQYIKEREEFVIPAFKKAIPYYENALKYNPAETGFLYNLKSIYYTINDGENLARVEKLLGD